MTIIECYNLAGHKQCEIDPEGFTAEELGVLLELQAYLGRVCQEKKEEERTGRIRFTK